MSLSEEDFRYVLRRQRFVKAWPWVGGVMAVLLLGCVAWMFYRMPALINAAYVAEALLADSLTAEEKAVMLRLLPDAVLMCFVLTGALIGFAFTAHAGERRYLEMLASLQPPEDEQPPA